jgi:uncharacterized protein DUF4307
MGPFDILSLAPKGSSMPLPRPAHGTGKWWVVGVVGCLLGAAVAVWLGLSMSLGKVTWTDTGYRVIDDRTVEVDFDVHRPAGQAVTCVVRALDRGYGTVGTVEVAIPGSPERSVHRQVTVRTTTRAVTGVVKSCDPA